MAGSRSSGRRARRDWEIYLHEGSTTLQLTDNDFDIEYNANDTDPDPSGSLVAWKGYVTRPGPAFDPRFTFIYDGQATILRTGGEALAISGDRFVVETDVVVPYQIRLIVLGGGAGSGLLDFEGFAFRPDISGPNVVWSGGDGTNASLEIYLYTPFALKRITDNEMRDDYPAISGLNVVWQGWDGNDWEIFFWDGSDVLQLTDNEVDDERPDVWGRTVVWHASDGNDLEIFMTTVPEPSSTTAIAAAMVALAILRRLRAGPS